MGAIWVKNIPDDVRDKFKILCLSEGVSMSEKIIDFMRKEASKIEVRRLDKKQGRP